jgi:hypothetical protein
VPLTLVAPLPEDDPGPVLTPPPNPSKPSPEPTQSERELALVWLAEGTVSTPGVESLKADGWTSRTALAALRATRADFSLALRNGPGLRLVQAGEAA